MHNMKSQPGFVAALDQSGGSTPHALALYGIKDRSWEDDDEMFDLVHQMRTRVITSPSFTGERIIGAILFAGAYCGLYATHGTAAVTTFFIIANVGGILWLFSMYVYIPANFPTRMRSLGTGWTDGIGHLGAWGGVLLCGAVFTAGAPLGWILLITIPGALLPAVLVGAFGVGQRRRALEEMAR